MLWLLLGVAIGIALVLALPYLRKKRKASPASLMKRLIKLTHDPAVAKRLLDGERTRNPGLSEVELLKRVIRRLKRDRGR